MEISHKLKIDGNEIVVNITLFNYTEILYKELEQCGIIERLSHVPQLGAIQYLDEQQSQSTRLDYMFLQLYLHQIINEDDKKKNYLKHGYQSDVNRGDLTNVKDVKFKISQGDLLQLLIILTNIGHFYNTFTASKGLLLAIDKQKNIKEWIVNNDYNSNLINEILDLNDYRLVHIINAILIVNSKIKDTTIKVISRAIIQLYIEQNKIDSESKIKYIFNLFKKVRDVSYIINDLPDAKLPIQINIQNTENIKVLFFELLSQYNNNEPTDNLIKGMQKLLDSYKYNNYEMAFSTQQISMQISRRIIDKNTQNKFTYINCFLKNDSILNKKYKPNINIDFSNVLKITLPEDNKIELMELINKLHSKVNVCYYFREDKTITLLITIKKITKNKIRQSMLVVSEILPVLNKINYLACGRHSDHFVKLTKFILQEIFPEYKIILSPKYNGTEFITATSNTIARNDYMTLEATRLQTIIQQKREQSSKTTTLSSQLHELQYVQYVSNEINNKNDIIVIYGNVLLTKNTITEAEFDGLIIDPKYNKLIILESKLTKNKEDYAKKELRRKMEKISFPYDENNIYSSSGKFKKDACLKIDL